MSDETIQLTAEEQAEAQLSQELARAKRTILSYVAGLTLNALVFIYAGVRQATSTATRLDATVQIVCMFVVLILSVFSAVMLMHLTLKYFEKLLRR